MFKILPLFIIACLFSNTVVTQERFLEFVNGWRCSKVVERDNEYISIGIGRSPDLSKNEITFSSINKVGIILDNWGFSTDSSLEAQYQYENSFYTEDNLLGISEIAPSDQHHYGLLTKFTSNYRDTIFTKFIQPDELKTDIRSVNSFNDSTYIITLSFINEDDNRIYMSMMEVDSVGETIWKEDYPCNLDYCELVPYQVTQARDGGYIISSREEFLSSGYTYHFNVMKVNSTGNYMWSKRIGNTDYNNYKGWIEPKADSNYLVAWGDTGDPIGGMILTPYDTNGVILSEMNELGDILWTKKLANIISDCDSIPYRTQYVTQMKKLSDDNFIIVTMQSAERGNLFKVSQNGELIWRRYIHLFDESNSDAGLSYTRIYGVDTTSDGGFICAGEFVSSPSTLFPSGYQSGFVLKLDEYGCGVATFEWTV